MKKTYILDDVCSLITDGSHFSPEDEGAGYPMLSVKDMGMTDFDFRACKRVNEATFRKLLANGCKPEINDVVVAKDGSYLKTAFPIKEDRDIALLSSIAILRPKPELVTPEYLSYFLKSSAVYRIVSLNYITGTALKRIILKGIKKIPIELPTVEEQEHRTRLLDSISLIIQQRKEQLKALDDLIKARFVEMFGDFDLALQKSDWLTISKIGTVVGGSTPKTSVPEYWDGEYKWISPAELKADSGIIYDSVKKITKAGVESCSLQELPVGTVILSSRAPIGKVAIAGNTFYCNQGFKNIICNDKVLPRYLYTLLLFNTEYLNSLGRGATFKEISKSIVENIRIPVPSIEKQKQFEAFVAQISKSKVVVQKALDEAQTLFDSLMQEYFG